MIRQWPVLLPMLLLAGGLRADTAVPTPPAVPAVAPDSAATMGALLQDLPTGLTGWTRRGPAESWNPENVEQILGAQAADLRNYRFLWGSSVRLSPPEGQLVIQVMALAFADPLDAYGVYSRNLAANTGMASVPDAAYWEGQQLHVCRGAYNLHFTPQPLTSPAPKQILQLAQLLAERLLAPEKPPLLLRLMPRARMIPQTLRYFWRAIPAFPQMSQGLLAEYEGERGNAMFLLSQTPDENTARQLYRQVRTNLDTAGERWPLPGLGAQVELVRSTERGLCFVMQERQYVAVGLRITDRQLAEALLRMTLTHIHILRP